MRIVFAAAAAAAALAAGAALAQPAHPAPGNGPSHTAPAAPIGGTRPASPPSVRAVPPPAARPAHPVPPPLGLDQRFHHDHYYPRPGFVPPRLPGGAISIAHGGRDWFFHGGVWFRLDGGRYVVAVPPVGIVVPVLPPAYVTLWVGGNYVYYANGLYYAPAPGGYAVVAPPPGADTATLVTPPPPPPANMVIYPRNGQGTAQIDADRQACNEWAAGQPGGRSDPGVFQRGFEACMDARGYTVR